MITQLIIFGANGMLGTYLTSYFRKKPEYDVIACTRAEFEITIESLSTLEDVIAAYHIGKHTCIINCTGLIPQRASTRTIEEYDVVNALFPQYLSKICRSHQAQLICPTTDCVFSGKKGKYTEYDHPDETSPYGISKLLGEPVDATVIRTSIIGEETNSRVSFLEFVRQSRGTITGWSNHHWNGITCYQYCKLIDAILSQNLFWKGVRHISSPEPKTKYEMACLIREVYQVPCFIQQEDCPLSVDKTLTSVFEPLFSIPPLEQQLREQREFTLA